MPRTRKFLSLAIYVVLPLAVAIFLVHAYDTAPGGYAADYTFAGPWVLGSLTAILGLTLVCFRKTRMRGGATLMSGLLLTGAFFVGIHVSESKGWVSWANEPLREIGGTQVQASEVVYYNLGVTEAQMEGFEKGSFDSNPDTTYFVRLPASEAHGHNGFAIGLIPSLPKGRREQIRAELARSPLVFHVYHDIVPKDIPAP
jgi:hypothetical protein